MSQTGECLPQQPIRVGLIGSGLMGAMHSETYRRLDLLSESPAFALQRVASRNERTGAAMAARYGWQQAVGDWRAVTGADDVDVVDICTPEESHHEIALHALAHGKHVFCEKPLAPTEAQAREMLNAAKDSGRVHMTGFVLRHWPALHTARGLLDSGRLGAVQGVRARYLIDGRTLLESSLRGLGSHVLDAASYLVGPVSAICALSRAVAEQPSIDAAVRALLRFESGATGTLELDREARGQVMDIGFTVQCERGTVSLGWKRREEVDVILDQQDGELAGAQRITIAGQDPPPLALFNGAGFGLDSLFVVQAQALAGAISGEAVSYPDFGAGWRAAAVAEAAIASWETDAWVSGAGGTSATST
jgi:predicted dehydrogenase